MIVFLIIFELFVVAFVVWGILHEDKLIEFEDKSIAKLKDKARKKRRDLCAKWLAKDGLVAVPVNNDMIKLLEHETK